MLQGLTQKQAENNIKQFGPNALADKKKNNPIKIFLFQFRDIMVMILLIAATISVLMGEIYDSITIMTIVLLNAILGFIQEYRTEKTLAALKNLSAPNAKVIRDGELKTIPAEQVTVGDIIDVEAGDRVPADAVILEANYVLSDEAILTGETHSVAKHTGNAGDTDNSLNRECIIYSGTNITQGHAQAKVIAVGHNTQMGKISSMLKEIEEPMTPLQKRLGELGKVLAIICIGVCIAVFLAGIIRGEPVFDMFLTGISIAIAAIPEGLPATVTICLAIAVSRMLKQNALVNKLHSVETLGCTSVICSDKTGTITENKMTVKTIFADMQELSVSGNGYTMNGSITIGDSIINPKSSMALEEILNCFVLCNNSSITADNQFSQRNRGSISSKKGTWTVTGDSTEASLLIAAAKGGIFADSLFKKYHKIHEVPFDSKTKFMTVTVSSGKGTYTAYTKGAPDVVIHKCTHILINGETVPLTPSIKSEILRKTDEFSSLALRMLAAAKKNTDKSDGSDDYGLTFLGLAGMSDPPREEAVKAIKLCAHSHIKTVMITGDHKNTAAAVAKQAGILRGGQVITGADLDNMSDEELCRNLNKYTVFARVNPSHKLRLVRAYKKTGQIVTMTGDGVNDAPAVKEADVGVSMGITGTDVTKEAADVILLDDNFATLVKAVEQGRSIYSNIRKFVRYLLSCNIGEVVTMFFGIIIGLPVVLLPTQILLVNLVTDGLPAIALGMEPLDKSVMKRPPRKPDESFFSDGLMSKIIFRGIFIGLCTLGCFTTVLRMGGSIDAARTGALITLVLSQLIHVFECKNEHGSIFSVKYFNNIKLILAVLISAAVLVGAVISPSMQLVFSTVMLTKDEIIVSVLFSIAVPVIDGIRRCFRKNS